MCKVHESKAGVHNFWRRRKYLLPVCVLTSWRPWKLPVLPLYKKDPRVYDTELVKYLNETRNSLLCVCSFVVFVDLWIFISLQNKLNQQVRFNNFKNSDISFSYKGRDVIFCVSVTNMRKIKWMKRYHYMSRYGKYNMQLLSLQLQAKIILYWFIRYFYLINRKKYLIVRYWTHFNNYFTHITSD